MRPPTTSSLVAAAALVAALVFAPSAGASGVTVYGPKLISRDTPLPQSCDGLRQETDTMVAADPSNPRHLVATWDQDDHRSNVTASTTDGGASWRTSTIPRISKCTGGTSDQVVDPWASIGANGVAYFASLPLSVSGFLVNHSADGGATWSSPATADPKAGLTDDLPYVLADPAHASRALLTWLRFKYTGSTQTGGDVRFSRTLDGGRTFSRPVVVHGPPPGRVGLESRVFQLPNGTLLDVFSEAAAQPVTAPQIAYAARSRDGGATWSAPTTIATFGQDPILDPDTGKPRYQFCCLFGAATGPGGRSYVAYTKVTGVHSGRVVVVRSLDGGRSWRPPKVVANVPAQTLEPAVAVAGDGTVGVTWYDFRNDRSGDRGLTTDYWFAYSRDAGKTWSQHHLAGPFDLRSSRRTDRPVGVYEGLAGLPHAFASTFIQAKPQAKLGSEDVFFARVTPPATLSRWHERR